MPAQRAAVIGTGTMGPGIAEVFALGGWEVALCGRSGERVESGLSRARLAGTNLEKFGLTAPGGAAAAAERLRGTTDLESAVAEADFVVETIVEDIAAKQDCFERIARAARPEAILTSNTSGLSITEIASVAARPERVAGMHWWNPPHLVPLVEVVCGERTGRETADAVTAAARALGKRPVLVRQDVPGFIANRMQYALLREAADIVGRGIASAEDVDLAMRAGPGLRYAALGPLETADFIGLDVVGRVMEYLLPALNPSLRTPALVTDLARSGKLGSKTGAGFYDYPERREAELLTERDAKLARLLKAGFGK